MPLPYTLTTHDPTQLGLIVLQSDETLENDMRRLLPPEAHLLVSRVPSAATVSSASLAAMADHLTAAARLMPQAARFGSVGYGCTSGSATIGALRVAELIQQGTTAQHVTDPVSALVAAARSLGLRRIGLVSPYVASVSDQLRRVLTDHGLSIGNFGSFDEPIEANVVRIAPKAIADAAITMAQDPDVDGIFLSCTNLRTLDVIAQIEEAAQKPALSSNQVLAWHMCQQSGLDAAPDAPGRLFAR